MIDFLLEGRPRARAQLVEVPAVEFESAGGRKLSMAQ